MRDQTLDSVLQIRGAVTRIAAACNISTAAVSQWRKVPKKHLLEVSQVSGLPPEQLRPDLMPETPNA
ncbi:MAG TPA: YdaS family helix-turn-helix protein [Halothiobacillus sp.]|nr:YdaS family helix-turn-helix protein [Halothiobacillus sp.]